jgi:hypothetical protein
VSNALKGRGDATIDVFGGLVLNMSAEGLPEGASPRNWDVDYQLGQVETRDGLSSVYLSNASAEVVNAPVATLPAIASAAALSPNTVSAPGWIAFEATVAENLIDIFVPDVFNPNAGYFFRLDGRSTYFLGQILSVTNVTLGPTGWSNIGAQFTSANPISMTGQSFQCLCYISGTGLLMLFVNGVLQVSATDTTYTPSGIIKYGYEVSTTLNTLSPATGSSSVVSSNFNWVNSFSQNTGLSTIALDASGTLWKEDVTNNPGHINPILAGLLPGSFVKGATADNSMYMMFSDLTTATDRPRQYDGTNFYPISQVGPGAPPAFQSNLGAATSGTVTSFAIVANVITVTGVYSVPFTAGEMIRIAGTGTFLDGTILVVAGSPAPDGTSFTAPFTHANTSSSGLSGTATPQFSYPITSITQVAARTSFVDMLWSDGPGSTSPGTTVTIYYSNSVADAALNATLTGGVAAYIYVKNAQFGNGTWQVTGMGIGTPPGGGSQRFFLKYQINTTGFSHTGGGNATGSYQPTLATVNINPQTPILGLNIGDNVAITNETPSGWDGTWAVPQILKGSVLNIVQTQMSSAGVATYTFTVAAGTAPVSPTNVGSLVNVTNCLNGNGIFNGTALTIANISGSTFTVKGFASGAIASSAEAGTADVSVNQFNIDPGVNVLGTLTSPIFGSGSAGTLTLVGTAQQVAAGTRQAVVFFLTETGYETFPSSPITFTTLQNGNYILASSIPIGPSNTVARGIAFTEAGQNGVPGANFYVIPRPVVIPASVASQALVYSSTIINDNVTTSAKFTFTDAVLLAGDEIDVQGNDLFNLIELGSSGWCLPYAGRMFYGLQLNKVQNFTNLSFDGGYVPVSGGPVTPLGWNRPSAVGTVDLRTSPVTGQELYLANSTGSLVPFCSQITQTAYQDAYQVPIILPNTTYSVRVAARCPSGIQQGTLTLQLVNYDITLGFTTVYGTFSVPLASMSTNTAVFSGTLLTTAFLNSVPPQLNLMLQVVNMSNGADCGVDRIEVYPTATPVLGAQVYGSYVGSFESVDASANGGIIDTSVENSQPVMGGVVMKQLLYLLKTSSLYVTEDSTDSEPSGWTLDEISPTVGTVGINSYDSGEQWFVTACRAGVYVSDGRPPQKISQELQPLWDAINWQYGNTIVLKNDTEQRRLLCAVPLPTGPGTTSYQWLPNAPANANPTTPNVILMCRYEQCENVAELMEAAPTKVTMFGTLMSPDGRRKWSVWNIKSPYMNFVTRQDGLSRPLFVCNGISSGKIYQFLENQLSDDGVAINGLYTTYGAVSALKAKELPMFGAHRKQYTNFQATASGVGTAQVRFLRNVLDDPAPYTIPNGLTLTDPAYDDYYRVMNITANRLFTEISTNAVGSYFTLNKEILSGVASPWAITKPGPGGNVGIV